MHLPTKLIVCGRGKISEYIRYVKMWIIYSSGVSPDTSQNYRLQPLEKQSKTKEKILVKKIE